MIANSRVYNPDTGEHYLLSNDGSKFRAPDGTWINVSDAPGLGLRLTTPDTDYIFNK